MTLYTNNRVQKQQRTPTRKLLPDHLHKLFGIELRRLDEHHKEIDIALFNSKNEKSQTYSTLSHPYYLPSVYIGEIWRFRLLITNLINDNIENFSVVANINMHLKSSSQSQLYPRKRELCPNIILKNTSIAIDLEYPVTSTQPTAYQLEFTFSTTNSDRDHRMYKEHFQLHALPAVSLHHQRQTVGENLFVEAFITNVTAEPQLPLTVFINFKCMGLFKAYNLSQIFYDNVQKQRELELEQAKHDMYSYANAKVKLDSQNSNSTSTSTEDDTTSGLTKRKLRRVSSQTLKESHNPMLLPSPHTPLTQSDKTDLNLLAPGASKTVLFQIALENPRSLVNLNALSVGQIEVQWRTRFRHGIFLSGLIRRQSLFCRTLSTSLQNVSNVAIQVLVVKCPEDAMIHTVFEVVFNTFNVDRYPHRLWISIDKNTSGELMPFGETKKYLGLVEPHSSVQTSLQIFPLQPGTHLLTGIVIDSQRMTSDIVNTDMDAMQTAVIHYESSHYIYIDVPKKPKKSEKSEKLQVERPVSSASSEQDGEEEEEENENAELEVKNDLDVDMDTGKKGGELHMASLSMSMMTIEASVDVSDDRQLSSVLHEHSEENSNGIDSRASNGEECATGEESDDKERTELDASITPNPNENANVLSIDANATSKTEPNDNVDTMS